ncbi:MAG: TIM barrel protein [Chitinivibrionales bacterium]|nr:TIM barrel protein [Chitinivibrionales bacterium]
MQIVSLVADHFTQARWREGTFTAPDESLRRAAIEVTTRTMDLAAELGCDQVTLWQGQDGYDYPFATDYEQQRTWLAEGLREVCDHRQDIRVSLEYKLKEPRTRSYVSSAAVSLLLLNEVDRPNCGVVLDYGHALLGYENPAESVALLTRAGGHLMHVHMNDNFRSWDDDMIAGSVHTVELLEFLYWLDRCNYSGWITMDQFPYRLDGRDAVAESVAWLDTLRDALAQADNDEIAGVLSAKDAIAATRMVRRLLFGKGAS